MGRLLTVLTTEFTHFNLVIRLSKGKQPALFRVSPVEVAWVEQFAAVTGHSPFSYAEADATDSRGKPPSFQLCSRD